MIADGRRLRRRRRKHRKRGRGRGGSSVRNGVTPLVVVGGGGGGPAGDPDTHRGDLWRRRRSQRRSWRKPDSGCGNGGGEAPMVPAALGAPGIFSASSGTAGVADIGGIGGRAWYGGLVAAVVAGLLWWWGWRMQQQ